MAPSYLVLLRAGFTWPAGHPAAGGLLPHHFTLAGVRRRCLSVALSFGSPRLGVTQRPALWSPGLPLRPARGGRGHLSASPQDGSSPSGALSSPLVHRAVGERVRTAVALPRHVAHVAPPEAAQQAHHLVVERPQVGVPDLVAAADLL